MDPLVSSTKTTSFGFTSFDFITSAPGEASSRNQIGHPAAHPAHGIEGPAADEERVKTIHHLREIDIRVDDDPVVLAVRPDVKAVLDRLFDLLVVASDGRAVLAQHVEFPRHVRASEQVARLRVPGD